MAAKSGSAKEVRKFQSEASYFREEGEPLAARMTVHVIVIAVILLALLAFFAELDRVISSTFGVISTVENPTVIQALDPSIIKSLNIHDGERVKKGQLLVTLDPTLTQADVAALRQQVASLRAIIARDRAELTQTPLEYETTNDADQRHYNDLQYALYRDRQAQYQAQLRSFDERVATSQATLKKLQDDTAGFGKKSEIAQKLEEMRTTLLEKGAGSLMNQLQAQSDHLEAQRTTQFSLNSITETEHQLRQTVADRESFVRSWAGDLRKELVTSQNSLDAAQAQLEKAQMHQGLVEIRAPEDELILTVSKVSVGSVLKEGDPLYTAVPVSAPIVAEVHILARDVGFVRVGDPVKLKVDAFNFIEHGTAEGVVKSISEGAFFLDENTNQPTEPYYKAKITVDKLNFFKVPENFRLVPGMTLTADINVGKRSAAVYLLQGFLRLGGAMREP